MKLLITGFDPFGGATINPAYEAVKLLPDVIDGCDIIKLEVPTVFVQDGVAMKKAVEEHQPDIVLCVGQAGGRSNMTVEKIAVNLMDARIPDNRNQQPLDQTIAEDGENAYFAKLPVKAMVKAMKDAGIPASVSYSAGTYVCNDLMYRVLYLIDKKYPSMRGGFVHVPFLPEQVLEMPVGTASMSAETIAKALECGIKAILANEDDIVAVGGEIN